MDSVVQMFSFHNLLSARHLSPTRCGCLPLFASTRWVHLPDQHLREEWEVRSARVHRRDAQQVPDALRQWRDDEGAEEAREHDLVQQLTLHPVDPQFMIHSRSILS